jgi:hypothetical protein
VAATLCSTRCSHRTRYARWRQEPNAHPLDVLNRAAANVDCALAERVFPYRRELTTWLTAGPIAPLAAPAACDAGHGSAAQPSLAPAARHAGAARPAAPSCLVPPVHCATARPAADGSVHSVVSYARRVVLWGLTLTKCTTRPSVSQDYAAITFVDLLQTCLHTSSGMCYNDIEPPFGSVVRHSMQNACGTVPVSPRPV